ncbi:HPr family phosphocarrier protein [Microbacterium sp. A196]|uniref:HPr family phosphocarrier protein n=1 Tax=Microbacterium sp. A196 TaxID=3457320 RepID=UPI003FD5DE28
MIGIVIVSHSEALAHAAVELALQMVHGEEPPIRVASGAAGGFGTDAAAIAAALDELAHTDGVLIITDLGSAILSSELALDLRSSTRPVLISDGPFVEGTTAAIVSAAAGGTLGDIAEEASTALKAKRHPASDGAAPDRSPIAGRVTAEGALINPMGIHSRPAAMLVNAANTFTADIQITNATAGTGPVKANSMIGLLSLVATKDDVIRLEADGPDAAEAVAALQLLVLDGFGEVA